MNRRKGFSLIELLVVVSVVSLLMSLMAPSLRKIREQARRLSCQSNLRQWGILLTSHAIENNGRLFTGVNDQGYWWISELEQKLQDWKANRLWFCPSAQTPLLDEDGTGLEAGQWNVRCAWGIYQDSDDYEGQLGPNGISGSYGLNGYFLRIPMDEEYDSGIDAQEGHRNFNAIKQADQVPLFVDALRFDLWPTYRDSPAYYEFESWTKRSDMARCCINRHDGTVAMVFADGSSRPVGVKELWTLLWHKDFRTNGPWTQAGGMPSSEWPEWMRGFKDY